MIDKPNPPGEAFQLLAVIDEGGGDEIAAESGYRRALKHNPDLALSANNLAMILLRRRGDLNEAKELASRAVREAPNVAPYHDTLAQVHSARGDHDAAIASISTAVRLQPNDLQWYVSLARIFVQAGRIEDARKALDRVDRAVGDPERIRAPLRKALAEIRQAVTPPKSGTPPLQ